MVYKCYIMILNKNHIYAAKENLALQFSGRYTDLLILRIICWEICYGIELLLFVMLVILRFYVESTQEICFHSHSQVISFFTWWLLWLIDLLHAHSSKGNRMQLFGNDYISSNTNQEICFTENENIQKLRLSFIFELYFYLSFHPF